MKQYFYILGLRIIPKFYNKDSLDFKNLRNNNYYKTEEEAIAALIDIENSLKLIYNKLNN